MWHDLGAKTFQGLRDLGLSDDQIRSYFPQGSPMDRLVEAQLSDESGTTTRAFSSATENLAQEHGDWRGGMSRRVDLDTKLTVSPDGTVVRELPNGTSESIYNGEDGTTAPAYTGSDMTPDKIVAATTPTAKVDAAPADMTIPHDAAGAPDTPIDSAPAAPILGPLPATYTKVITDEDGSLTYYLLDGSTQTVSRRA
jgi:hypothetical protein